jgi:hypothetical protein
VRDRQQWILLHGTSKRVNRLLELLRREILPSG